MRGGATAAEMKEWLKIRRRRPDEVHPLDTGLTAADADQRTEQSRGLWDDVSGLWDDVSGGQE